MNIEKAKINMLNIVMYEFSGLQHPSGVYGGSDKLNS
jgi:hypothetical protein